MFAGAFKEQLEEAGLSELPTDEIIGMFSDEQIEQMLVSWERERHREKFEKFKNYFPDQYHMVAETEFYPRHLYPRHLEHFKAGAKFDERCFMAGNRVGKTVAGAYELTCHLLGRYPDWWEGRRFRKPIKAYACGKTNETTRDIVQLELFGEITWEGGRKTVDGTGMIPTEYIGRGNGQLTWKSGVADLIDTVKIKHKSGGWSRLGLKSYQQGRGAFEGTAQHVIWTDEEPEMDVYDEMRMRTMTTGGITILTYTPLEGLTDTVLSFLPAEMRPASGETLNADSFTRLNTFGSKE